MSVIRVVLACLCLLLPAGARAAEEQPLIPNLDFSDGLKGWGAWTGTTEHPWSLDAAVGHGGKPSLRIDAANRAGQVMVMANTDRLKPSERYALEVWWRLEKMSTDPQVDLRVIFRDDKGGWLTGTDLYPISSQAEGEWTRRRYRISTPARAAGASFGIWVRETTGVIRVSDMSVRPQPVGEFTIPSMYDYDPDAVLLGMAPLKKFQNLKETNSPFLARAKRWNQLLVNVGYWQEDVSRARRVLLYAGRKEGDLAAHVRALDAALAALDRLQQTYGRLYVAGKADALAAEFDPPAAALDAAAQAGQAALRKFVAGAAPAASGKWLAIPKAPTDQPWWDPVKKRPRYMLWLRWSDADFRDLEEPLNMGDCQTLTAGAPGKFENGVADWQNYLDQQKKNADAGARRFALITHYSLHDKGYLAPEFAKQQGGDPDLRLWDKEGKPQGAEAGVTMFNWLNPKVLAHMDDVLGQMARFFKDRREFQFYVDSWESAGPYAGGVRVGRNPSHAVPFREYLRARYGTLAALNARWGTHYTGFETITPAPEAPPAFGAPATPLAIESQRWAQEAYVDYLTRIRGTIAREDPTKPVLGEHSGLLGRVLSPRVVDSVDILGYHHRANTTMPLQVWMTSLQRVTGKPLGLYENFWGCQEDHPQRMREEKVMRAQMRRYLYRHAAWGRCVQTWWYAYTSAEYLTVYNGNWFTPVYDLSTFRYSAAGFPVEKAKVDRLESLLLNSEIVPSRVLLVQPYTAMLAQREHGETFTEWLAWHNLLFPRNQLYEAMPDTWFAEGKCRLADYDVVILPAATHLERKLTGQLLAFLRAGGTVIACGPPALYDEVGRPDGSLLAAAQVTAKPEHKPNEAWRFSYGAQPNAQGWVEATVGKGKMLLLPQSLNGMESRPALADAIRRRVVPAAEAPGTTLELLLRRLPDGRHLLCALNRDPDKATTGDVLVAGAFRRVADVDQERPVLVPATVQGGRTRFRVTLDAGATAYYLLAGD